MEGEVNGCGGREKVIKRLIIGVFVNAGCMSSYSDGVTYGVTSCINYFVQHFPVH